MSVTLKAKCTNFEKIQSRYIGGVRPSRKSIFLTSYILLSLDRFFDFGDDDRAVKGNVAKYIKKDKCFVLFIQTR